MYRLLLMEKKNCVSCAVFRRNEKLYGLLYYSVNIIGIVVCWDWEWMKLKIRGGVDIDGKVGWCVHVL